MGILGDDTPRKNTDFAEVAARLVENGQVPVGGSQPDVLIRHTANSLRNMLQLLDADPEYAKTLGINAQGIGHLQAAAGVLSKFTNS